MSKLVKIAVVALSVLAPCAAVAQVDNDSSPIVTCAAVGYDVFIFNKGTEPIAAGTEVHWSVPFARQRGSYALVSTQQPGERVVVSGALGSSYLFPGKICEASIG